LRDKREVFSREEEKNWGKEGSGGRPVGRGGKKKSIPTFAARRKVSKRETERKGLGKAGEEEEGIVYVRGGRDL